MKTAMINNEVYPTTYSPLRHHVMGFTETVSGYGSKLRSPYTVAYEGRTRRIYVTCYGNTASTWIIVNNQKVFVS